MITKNKQSSLFNSNKFMYLDLLYGVGKRILCIFRLWFCYIYVNWRIPVVCRGYEGKFPCEKH